MQCEQKELVFNLEISEDIKNLEIYSDEHRLKQIILNLVSNSLKFTFDGEISISCKLIESEDDMYVEFKVKDTGIGISSEQQAMLFTMFSMVSDSKLLNPNGSGIGLTVSKKYVEAMGGEIHLESIEDEGTIVTFTILVEPESMFFSKAIRPASLLQ